MKKILINNKRINLLFLLSGTIILILITGCSINKQETDIKDYTIEKITDISCKEDLDCKTPMEYLAMSRCPFTSKCIKEKCNVICPIFDQKSNEAPKIERIEIIGGDKDSHDCLIGAGYSWCETEQKCLRKWEEHCADDPLPEDSTELKDKAERIATAYLENSKEYLEDKGRDIKITSISNINSEDNWDIELNYIKEAEDTENKPKIVIGRIILTNWKVTGFEIISIE